MWAGLGGERPHSLAGTAHALGLSRPAAAKLQHQALRRLRRTAATGGCGSASSSTESAALAVATAATSAASSLLSGGPGSGSSAPASVPAADTHAVSGDARARDEGSASGRSPQRPLPALTPNGLWPGWILLALIGLGLGSARGFGPNAWWRRRTPEEAPGVIGAPAPPPHELAPEPVSREGASPGRLVVAAVAARFGRIVAAFRRR